MPYEHLWLFQARNVYGRIYMQKPYSMYKITKIKVIRQYASNTHDKNSFGVGTLLNTSSKVL